MMKTKTQYPKALQAKFNRFARVLAGKWMTFSEIAVAVNADNNDRELIRSFIRYGKQDGTLVRDWREDGDVIVTMAK